MYMSVNRAHSDSSTPSPLAQNRGKKAGHPDQEEGTMDSEKVRKAIEEAVKEGFAACSSQTSVTQPDRTAKKDKKSLSGKAGSSTGTAASEKRTPEMAHIFTEVMTALIPVVTATVTAAVNAALLKQTQKTTEESIKRQGETVQQQQLLLNSQNDQLEQYSRRWSIRVKGLGEGDLSGLECDAEETNEQQVNKIIKLVGASGVTIQPTDISICHRVGPKVRDGQRIRKRHVICRFISRTTKASVINNARNLKSSDEFKGVYINEDLTRLRAGLFATCRRTAGVDKAITRDGKIICYMKDNKPRVIVENPDHLFDLGFNDVEPNIGAFVYNAPKK